MNEHHKKFLQGLESSKASVWLVARWLSDHGYAVRIPPTSKAPEQKDWQAHADDGDLEIAQRIEVKALTCDFTSRDDWPFPDFIVCAKHAYDNAKPKPYRICYLNKAMTHLAVLDCRKTHMEWVVKTVRDSRFDDREQETYVCDKGLPQFVKLTNEELT